MERIQLISSEEHAYAIAFTLIIAGLCKLIVWLATKSYKEHEDE